MSSEDYKRQAAAAALEFVEPGMRLGLGTGSTAKHFVALLADRVRAGLDVVGVATSEATRTDAERLGRIFTTGSRFRAIPRGAAMLVRSIMTTGRASISIESHSVQNARRAFVSLSGLLIQRRRSSPKILRPAAGAAVVAQTWPCQRRHSAQWQITTSRSGPRTS